MTRAQVLGFRAHRQGLDRRPGVVEAVVALGLQDTPAGSAAAARRVRAGQGPASDEVIVWTWRGALHLHRGADLPALAEALWPVDDADATRRIGTGAIKEGAGRGLAAFTEAAEAVRAVVTERMPKGEVSGEVSARIAPDLCFDCRPCGARHISGALFQQVGLAAGIQVITERGRTFLAPLPDVVRPRAVPRTAAGTASALRRYLRVLGPASPAASAAQLGCAVTVARRHLPTGLVEVDGPVGAALLPEEDLDALLGSPQPRGVRLLAPGDPWLSAKDRDLVVPDAARAREVWRVLGNPGVVWVDGDVRGTWRAKQSRSVLTLTVTAFEPLPAAVMEAVEAEAEHLAAGRGVGTARVVRG